MCIGNLRSGTESISVYIRNRNKESLRKAVYYYGIIFVFAMGAGIGGLLTIWLGVQAIWVSCILLLISCLLMIREKL